MRTVRGAGVDLAVVEQGDPARPTVLLVHGYPDTKEVWTGVAQDLARRFHVVAYDVRGAGASGAPADAAGFDLDRLEDDVLAVLDATAPGRRAHVVGHDWGSIQGWRFATSPRVAPRLASFTSMSGPCLDHVGRWLRDRPSGAGEVARQLVRSWYIYGMMLPGGPALAWRTVGRALPRLISWVEGAPVPAPTLARDGEQGTRLYRRNFPPALARPREALAGVPVQLIVALQDPFVSPRLFDDLPRFAPSLRRRDVDAGHWLPRTHPALVARLVSEHVEDVERGPLPLGLDHRQVPLRYGELALITGAGSGIGRATAFALAEQGARVIAVDLDLPAAERTAALCRDLGAPEARARRCDVGDATAMEALARAVLAEHGPPDVLVNNAGIGVAGPFLDTTEGEWRRTLDVNLWGVIHGCRLFGRAMAERGRGAIVNVASAAAFLPTRAMPAYATSKAAVLMLSECLRAELAPRGVRVIALCPGVVATNITRSTRFAGKDAAEETRLRARATRLYARRAFGPELVADEVLRALAADQGVVPVTLEAKLLRALDRLAPARLREALARLQPV